MPSNKKTPLPKRTASDSPKRKPKAKVASTIAKTSSPAVHKPSPVKKNSPTRRTSPRAKAAPASTGSIVPVAWPGGHGTPTKEISNPAVASGVDAAFVHATQHMLVRRRMVTKPAVVLDIDDTALIGPDTSQRTHGPVHAFYKKAIGAGVAVFFVTARDENQPGNRAETLKQLKDCGYTGFTRLLMAHEYTHAFTQIKRNHRRAIEKEGYEILVNAGDQWPDLVSEKIPQTVLHQAETLCKRKPFIFYNVLENCGTLCIKLWSP